MEEDVTLWGGERTVGHEDPENSIEVEEESAEDAEPVRVLGAGPARLTLHPPTESEELRRLRAMLDPMLPSTSAGLDTSMEPHMAHASRPGDGGSHGMSGFIQANSY